MSTESICFKTGCCVWLESEGLFLDAADIHIVGNTAVIWSLHTTYDKNKISYRQMAYVRRSGRYFLRQFASGAMLCAVLVCEQPDLVLGRELQHHWHEWYGMHELMFSSDSRP